MPGKLEVNLTLRSRIRVSKFLVMVYFVLLLVSVSVVYCGYIVMDSMALFQDVVRNAYSTDYYPSVVVACGVYASFISLCGIQACLGASDWKRLFRGSHTWQVSLALCFYGSFICIIFLVAVFIMTNSQQWPIRRAFLIGMKEAMTLYRTNRDVKEKIDTIQMKWQCCGAVTYSEWFRISWVDTTFVNLMSVVNQQKMEGGLLITNSVPFSCCDVLSPRPCIEVDVTDSQRHFAYDPSKALTIYTTGCVDQLTAELNRNALDHLHNILLTLFITMLVVTVVYRYLQTSTDVALTSGDPTVTAPGFLYSSGEPPKPTNPPATFDALQERMEALDELANMTDQEIAERVKEIKEKKALKEKKLREKEIKRQQRKEDQRHMYKWLDDWTPVAPTAGVTADDINNANNINNAAAASASASAAPVFLRRQYLTSTSHYPSQRPTPVVRSQYRRDWSCELPAPPAPSSVNSDNSGDDDDSERHGRQRDDGKRRRRRHSSSKSSTSSSTDDSGRRGTHASSSSSKSSSSVDSGRRRRHTRRRHSTRRRRSGRRRSRTAIRRHHR